MRDFGMENFGSSELSHYRETSCGGVVGTLCVDVAPVRCLAKEEG